MNIEQAKFILSGFRCQEHDGGKAEFAEALELAKNDPQLAAWLVQEQQIDDAIAGKLRQSPVPADLKNTILAGQKIIRPLFWSRRRIAWTVAASFVFLAFVFAQWFRPVHSSELIAYRRDLIQSLNSGSYHLQTHSADVTQLRQSLAANQGHADFVLPPGMTALKGHGCEVFRWKGKPVTMVCFQTAHTGVVHLFVINKADLPNVPVALSPQFAEEGAWATAAWGYADKTYLLIAHGKRSALEKIL